MQQTSNGFGNLPWDWFKLYAKVYIYLYTYYLYSHSLTDAFAHSLNSPKPPTQSLIHSCTHWPTLKAMRTRGSLIT